MKIYTELQTFYFVYFGSCFVVALLMLLEQNWKDKRFQHSNDDNEKKDNNNEIFICWEKSHKYTEITRRRDNICEGHNKIFSFFAVISPGVKIVLVVVLERNTRKFFVSLLYYVSREIYIFFTIYCRVPLIKPQTLNIFFILHFTICIIFRRFLLLLLLLFPFWMGGCIMEMATTWKLSRVKLYSYMIVIIFFRFVPNSIKSKKSFLQCGWHWGEEESFTFVAVCALNVLSLLSLLSFYYYYYFTDDFHIKSHTTISTTTTTTWTTYKILNEWITLFLCLLFEYFLCVCVFAPLVVAPSSFITFFFSLFIFLPSSFIHVQK